jgi:hypothetical protein
MVETASDFAIVACTVLRLCGLLGEGKLSGYHGSGKGSVLLDLVVVGCTGQLLRDALPWCTVLQDVSQAGLLTRVLGCLVSDSERGVLTEVYAG